MQDGKDAEVHDLLATPALADALESDQFKRFLDHIPIAIAVAKLPGSERIVYVNLEFERLTGASAAQAEGRAWSFLRGEGALPGDSRRLGEAVVDEHDYLGVFQIERNGEAASVDVWSNIIGDDEGNEAFRLIALADAARCESEATMQRALADKDAMLRELQHRVRNNLQMITALIRMEARNMRESQGEAFDRLAGRIEALALLYDRMDQVGEGAQIDLGVYLGQIATAVMAAHAVDGIHLELATDPCPVSPNIAMPTGLAVNELVTNALKHAFVDRDGGTIRLECVADGDEWRVVVADDGVGLPQGVTWPQPGKMGAMIAHALQENGRARIEVASSMGDGVRVILRFPRA
jgi:PAS domain S-box-containing protein